MLKSPSFYIITTYIQFCSSPVCFTHENLPPIGIDIRLEKGWIIIMTYHLRCSPPSLLPHFIDTDPIVPVGTSPHIVQKHFYLAYKSLRSVIQPQSYYHLIPYLTSCVPKTNTKIFTPSHNLL